MLFVRAALPHFLPLCPSPPVVLATLSLNFSSGQHFFPSSCASSLWFPCIVTNIQTGLQPSCLKSNQTWKSNLLSTTCNQATRFPCYLNKNWTRLSRWPSTRGCFVTKPDDPSLIFKLIQRENQLSQVSSDYTHMLCYTCVCPNVCVCACISVGTSCKPPTDHLRNPVHLSPFHISMPLIMLLSPIEYLS